MSRLQTGFRVVEEVEGVEEEKQMVAVAVAEVVEEKTMEEVVGEVVVTEDDVVWKAHRWANTWTTALASGTETMDVAKSLAGIAWVDIRFR